jgi:hypothetical protein
VKTSFFLLLFLVFDAKGGEEDLYLFSYFLIFSDCNIRLSTWLVLCFYVLLV